jgi:hypothetical protein
MAKEYYNRLVARTDLEGKNDATDLAAGRGSVNGGTDQLGHEPCNDARPNVIATKER